MTSYQLLQIWLPIIAIILISLYQLLIYLSLISASTSLSLCQHFIFISANTSFSTLGVKMVVMIKPKRNFTWSTSVLDSTGNVLHFTEHTLHSTGSILHTTGRISIELKKNKDSFSAKVKHGYKRISKVFFVYVYNASYIG